MHTVTWGIIGCGDVAEVKSGPAFQKIKNSEIVAVMRRDGKKAAAFAKRHQVPSWYDNAQELLENPTINSIYVATPPSTHLEYAVRALEAGKNVYLEKPMALSAAEAREIIYASKNTLGKITIAHYRRCLPSFSKVKELLDQKSIGDIRFVDLKLLQATDSGIIANTEDNWRLNPQISGGGYFHDLAPHQLDMMYYLFGDIAAYHGFSNSQNRKYGADDILNGIIAFKSGVQFSGIWCFSVADGDKLDECTIYGSRGMIRFSFYGTKVILLKDGKENVFEFENPKHVQQPMIDATVEFFLGRAKNPCTANDGLEVMKLLDGFTK